jgi:conjugal transfer/type IV secretion protein DotA/TraY
VVNAMLDLLAKPDCTDIAWSWVLTMFGTEGTSCSGSIIGAADVNTPYANAFAVLTAALAFFGGLFMAYHTVAGIVSSAYSGKVLGERWHQIWAPLRIVLGFGLLIPVSGGFSSIHYILRDVVGVAAVQLANGVVGAYADTAFKSVDAGVSQSKVSTMSGKDLADKFFDKEICAGVVSKMSSGWFTIWPYTASHASNGQTIGNSTYWHYGDCGVISVESVSGKANDGIFSTSEAQAALKAFDQKRKDATEKLRGKVAALGFYDTLGTFIDEHSSSFDQAGATASAIKDLRKESIIKPGIQDALNAAATEWNKSVGDAASTVFDTVSKKARESMKSDMPKYGFMVAGSYERSLSAISGLVSNVANVVAGTTVADFDDATKNKVANAKMAALSSNAVDSNDKGMTDNNATNSDVISGIMQTILPSNLENMYTGQVSADPIGDMIMFGNNLLTIASYSILATALLAGASVGTGQSIAGLVGLGAVQGIFEYVSSWFSWILMIMIIVGLMHSFVLPMLPMIMIFTMGVSWLIMFMEGAIAGVLWAFVFIRMDGTEFFDQKQSPGVGLLFNLLLRPALGMLAYCGMLLLLPALLNALNQVWQTAFSLQTGNHGGFSLVWLWQWCAQMVMFCWMQWTITLRITSLIPTIADRVGHWMGISSTSGYGDSQETTAHIGALIAAGNAISKAPIAPQGGRGRPRMPDVSGRTTPKDVPDGNDEGGSSMGKNGEPKKKR